jgi:hypothetical protein
MMAVCCYYANPEQVFRNKIGKETGLQMKSALDLLGETKIHEGAKRRKGELLFIHIFGRWCLLKKRETFFLYCELTIR